VLNLVPEGVSVKACSFSNLKVGYLLLKACSDSQRIFLCVTDEENWICLAVMH
jgi:hypothetical protein